MQLKLVSSTTREWDALFETVAPHYRFLVRRDARYVAWRYLQSPAGPYAVVEIRKWRRLIGWVVVGVRGRRLTIGDALIHPEHADAFDVVLRHLARVYPVDALDGWFPPRPAWFASVIDEIFELRPEPQDLSVMCVPFRLPDAVARMRESFYYTIGDSDLF